MCEIIIGWLEEKLRKLYQSELQKRKKEKFPLLKLQLKELSRILIRVIFYIILIFGGYFITEITKTDTPSILWLILAVGIVFLIVFYEYLDHIFEEDIKRLKSKSHKKYGPGFNTTNPKR